jgi:hypothetical protein
MTFTGSIAVIYAVSCWPKKLVVHSESHMSTGSAIGPLRMYGLGHDAIQMFVVTGQPSG